MINITFSSFIINNIFKISWPTGILVAISYVQSTPKNQWYNGLNITPSSESKINPAIRELKDDSNMFIPDAQAFKPIKNVQLSSGQGEPIQNHVASHHQPQVHHPHQSQVALPHYPNQHQVHPSVVVPRPEQTIVQNVAPFAIQKPIVSHTGQVIIENTLGGIDFDCRFRPSGHYRDSNFCDVYHACVYGYHRKTYTCPIVGDRTYFDEFTQRYYFNRLIDFI